MRLATLVLAFVAVTLPAAVTANPRIVKQYAGRIIISPDPAPTLARDLATYLKANAVAGDHYEAIKGSPWEVNLVGLLSRDPRAAAVTLELVDAADPKQAPLAVLAVSAKQRVVIAAAKLTTAAGFAANTTYLVTLVANKHVLAKAELRLRD